MDRLGGKVPGMGMPAVMDIVRRGVWSAALLVRALCACQGSVWVREVRAVAVRLCELQAVLTRGTQRAVHDGKSWVLRG